DDGTSDVVAYRRLAVNGTNVADLLWYLDRLGSIPLWADSPVFRFRHVDAARRIRTERKQQPLALTAHDRSIGVRDTDSCNRDHCRLASRTLTSPIDDQLLRSPVRGVFSSCGGEAEIRR